MSAGVRQRAFCRQPGKPVSAPADSQASSANPSETCAEWNLRRVKLAPVQEETWSTTPDTGANWSAIPAGEPALRPRRWWEKRMTNGEKRKEGGGGELMGTKNQSCVTCAIAQRSDPAHRRSHCLHNDACKTVRFLIFRCMLFTCEAAPGTSQFCS